MRASTRWTMYGCILSSRRASAGPRSRPRSEKSRRCSRRARATRTSTAWTPFPRSASIPSRSCASWATLKATSPRSGGSALFNRVRDDFSWVAHHPRQVDRQKSSLTLTAYRSESSLTLTAYLPGADDDPLLTGESLETDRPARVQLVSRNADLRPEPELVAVREPRRGVHEHRAGIDFAQEAQCVGVVLGDDRVGMLGAVFRDMFDRGIERRHDPDGEYGCQVLGVPVVLGGGFHRGHERARRGVSP